MGHYLFSPYKFIVLGSEQLEVVKDFILLYPPGKRVYAGAYLQPIASSVGDVDTCNWVVFKHVFKFGVHIIERLGLLIGLSVDESITQYKAL